VTDIKTYSDSDIPDNDEFGETHVKACYYFFVHHGDNITINTTNSGSGRLYFGGLPHEDSAGNICTLLIQQSPFFYSVSSNDSIAGWPYNGLIDASVNFSIVSDLDQMMMIFIKIETSPGTIQYTINKITATIPQDPAINDLQIQINALTTNITTLQNQTQNLTNQINAINSTLKTMNQTQQGIIENITNLWTSYNQLNTSITQLEDVIQNLNQTSSENFKWIEENLTTIKTDIDNIQNILDSIPKNETYLTGIQDQITKNSEDIIKLNDNITQIINSIPSEYNDTALRNRISALETENAQLREDLNALNKNKKEKDDDDEKKEKKYESLAYAGTGMGTTGLIIGLIAVAMLLSRPRRAVTEKVRSSKPKKKKPDFVDADEEE